MRPTIFQVNLGAAVWCVRQGEHWLVSGPSGAGKSALLQVIQGSRKWANADNALQWVVQKAPASALVDFAINQPERHYYQQRFDATETDEVLCLRDFLLKPVERDERLLAAVRPQLVRFGLLGKLSEPVIKLSSGEYRKACVLRAALQRPAVMLLDDPYSGVDRESIEPLDNLLADISQNLTLIVCSNRLPPPRFVTHMLQLNDMALVSAQPVPLNPRLYRAPSSAGALPVLAMPQTGEIKQCEHLVKMRNVSISYDNISLLRNINWAVNRGDRWGLVGKNGSGKSTLLSLMYADHPLAYTNEIYLFDRRRGTGESVWDIKENISYYSSEMYAYQDRTVRCRDVILGGLRSNPYHRLAFTEQRQRFFDSLVTFFMLRRYLDLPLGEMPSVRQRLALLAAALLKAAPLILLDEPFHGFDSDALQRVRLLLNNLPVSSALVFVSHVDDELPDCVTTLFHLINGKGEVLQRG